MLGREQGATSSAPTTDNRQRTTAAKPPLPLLLDPKRFLRSLARGKREALPRERPTTDNRQRTTAAKPPLQAHRQRTTDNGQRRRSRPLQAHRQRTTDNGQRRRSRPLPAPLNPRTEPSSGRLAVREARSKLTDNGQRRRSRLFLRCSIPSAFSEAWLAASAKHFIATFRQRTTDNGQRRRSRLFHLAFHTIFRTRSVFRSNNHHIPTATSRTPAARAANHAKPCTSGWNCRPFNTAAANRNKSGKWTT